MKNKGTRRKFFITLSVTVIIGIAALIAFYVFHPKKAVQLVFPDLNNISAVNAVIKNDSAHLKISLVLQNKNPYKLSIDTIAFELLLSDTSLTKETIPLNIKQERYELDTVKLPLDLHIKQVMKLIRGLQDQDSTHIEIKGFIVYQTIFGRTKIDFDQTKKIEVPVPPQIKVIKVEREGFSLKDKILKVKATVELINKGKNIDLELSHIEYDMTVKGTLHTNGVLKKTLIVKPQSSITLEIPMEVEVYHPLKTIWKIKTDDDRLPYSLHLKCMIKEHVSEKAFNSPAELTATGVLELKK